MSSEIKLLPLPEWYHRVDLGVGSVTRYHEIEYRLVAFARSVGNDSSKGTKGVSSRLTSECRLQHVFNVSNRLVRIGSVYQI
jgi:hypothetical protein